jgi:Phage Tail Collar Domain
MAGSKTADDGESGTCGLTRRRLLQGAGGTLVAVAGAGLLAPLGAARPEEEIFRRHAGEIRLFVGSRLPPGWLPCDGRQFTRSEYPQLAEALSYRYSPSGQIPRFRLPDLRGRTAIGHGEGPGQPARYLGHRGDALAEGGDGPGGLGLTYVIATHDGDGRSIVGEVRPFAFLGHRPDCARMPAQGRADLRCTRLRCVSSMYFRGCPRRWPADTGSPHPQAQSRDSGSVRLCRSRYVASSAARSGGRGMPAARSWPRACLMACSVSLARAVLLTASPARPARRCASTFRRRLRSARRAARGSHGR